ncbi:encapsulin-associated ferritin-like protein [uncultured Thiothrix sp.]|uniref:encapsulin-associated ferritin-like protein n=1 Tax=uncultured Thiothrix sp. TaxID=223185 RepID=UPI0026230D6A|nr:encapsulin-associated ferritin-like protein [uncultured Thiothrix sp.]HMT93018.1 ferritin [Thiolinea sp.]
MSHEGYHEPIEELSDATRDMHRAIESLMEEFEAVDWYNQRVDACKDKDLKAILEHNRDEEKEHAAMVLEWIRRKDPKIDEFLKEFLFKSGSITQAEEEGKAEKPAAKPKAAPKAKKPTPKSE